METGLRSGNRYSPYPEEMNRRLTTAIATLHFAPTPGNKEQLIKSGVRHTQELLDNPSKYNKMDRAINPYGDGKAAERIVEILSAMDLY